MITEGGACRSKQSLRVEVVDGGINLTKTYRSTPKRGHEDDCPNEGVGTSNREYTWNGRCFAHQEHHDDFGVIDEDECSVDGLRQGDDPVFLPSK